jgi:hypothetical protein
MTVPTIENADGTYFGESREILDAYDKHEETQEMKELLDLIYGPPCQDDMAFVSAYHSIGFLKFVVDSGL